MKATCTGAFVLLALVSAECFAVEASVLNLPFGRPLDRDIQRCPSNAAKAPDDYCGVERRYKAGSVNAMRLLPPMPDSARALPSWVKVDFIDVTTDAAGNIYEIRVKSDGPAYQAEVIESISLRFGRPATVNVIPKQNAFGASRVVQQAIWLTPEAWILHDCYEISECYIVFKTRKAFDEQAARSASQKRQPIAP